MDQKDILLTNITIKGHFHDIYIYSRFLYLWKNKHEVRIYHWGKLIKEWAIEDLPIYQDRLHNQILKHTENSLKPFLFKTITFEKAVYDSLIYRHRLYYLNENGFYYLEPEKAVPTETLLTRGNFCAIKLNRSNRMILVSDERGVFEWYDNKLIQWDSIPTYKMVWSDENILQLDKNNRPIQLLQFEFHQKIPYLMKRIPAHDLSKMDLYYETSLELDKSEEEDYRISLFEFLPETESLSSKKIGEQVKLALKPHKILSGMVLDNHSLYLSQQKSKLRLELKGDLFLSIANDEYHTFRIYQKSRHYQNQLHLLSDQQLTILIFNQLL